MTTTSAIPARRQAPPLPSGRLLLLTSALAYLAGVTCEPGPWHIVAVSVTVAACLTLAPPLWNLVRARRLSAARRRQCR